MVEGISLQAGAHHLSHKWPEKSPRVDVMGLIQGILDLPLDEMRERILRSGLDLLIIQCEAHPWEEEKLQTEATGHVRLSTSEVSLSNTLNQADFDKLILFSHVFSLHGYTSQRTNEEYQKYLELLLKLSLFLPEDVQSRILSVSRVTSGSEKAKYSILEKNWLLPDVLILRMFWNPAESMSRTPSPLTRLAFAGVISYKKIFQWLLAQGWVAPASQMKDITNSEYQIFIRETLKKWLDFLRKYLYGKDFWVYYKKTKGETAMKSIFERFEALERWYSARIGQLELMALSKRDFMIFYDSYNLLVDEIISNNAHPEGIAMYGVGASV